MNPTLDECNFLLDDLAATLPHTNDLRLRIHEENGQMFVAARWRRADCPGLTEFHVPPDWKLSEWTRDKNGVWRARITQIAKPAVARVRHASDAEKNSIAQMIEYHRKADETAANGKPPPPLPAGWTRGRPFNSKV